MPIILITIIGILSYFFHKSRIMPWWMVLLISCGVILYIVNQSHTDDKKRQEKEKFDADSEKIHKEYKIQIEKTMPIRLRQVALWGMIR
jgi:hypothetical protein